MRGLGSIVALDHAGPGHPVAGRAEECSVALAVAYWTPKKAFNRPISQISKLFPTLLGDFNLRKLPFDKNAGVYPNFLMLPGPPWTF